MLAPAASTTAGGLAVVVRAFWQAQADGDRRAAEVLLAEDLVWTVEGRHSRVARTYRGRDAFFDELIAELGRTFEPGTVSLDLRGVYEDAAQQAVVTELLETARTREGLAFEVGIVTVMAIRDGRITACREYMDLHEVRLAFGEESPVTERLAP